LCVLQQLLWADKELETPTIGKVLSATNVLNDYLFGQEALAQMQTVNLEDNIIGQEVSAQIQNITETLSVITRQPVVQIENSFICSPVSKINWASHVVLMDSKLWFVRRMRSWKHILLINNKYNDDEIYLVSGK
jgi:hypothetical protein